MLIFGTRGFSQTDSNVVVFPCPKCGNYRHGVGGLIRYFHLYWIPCFAYELQPITQCLHCRFTVSGDQIPGAIRADIQSTLFAWSKIWWCFSGLMLAGAGFIVALLVSLFS